VTRLKVGYGKIGRSMPLPLDKCGNLGGDVEMSATVGTLARRNPDIDFYLLGRNTGEVPTDVGLPENVINPWTEWAPVLLAEKRARKLNKSNLSVEEHQAIGAIFDQITLPTFTAMDHIIMWAGQHGTTNTPLPSVKDPSRLTKPHDWSAHYVAFITRGINTWRDVNPGRREEIWLNSDPRNYLKLRDLKWPLRHPVLSQHTYINNIKHARYGDGADFAEWSGHDLAALDDPADRDRVWVSTVRNIYARLELNGLMPNTPFGNLISFNDDWENRDHFGLFINETRRYVREDIARVTVMNDWVMPLRPAWVHGKWSDESMRQIADANPDWTQDIRPAPWDRYYPRLHAVRCTFTTPASGTGWATAKPWEAFAAGTVCFFHPEYDVQNNILGDAHAGLTQWLRVKSVAELRHRVEYLNSDDGRPAWEWIVRAQRAHFDNATASPRFAELIEERLRA
jgi:hypothetical protein